jgi:hypothetical protein
MRFSVAFAALFLTVGCAKHSGSYEQLTATGTAEQSGLLATEGDGAWADRDEEAKLRLALDKYEAAFKADPTNRHAAVRLTRGWYWLGDVKTNDKDAKLAAWDTAVQWGSRCMAINADFTALLEKGNEKESTAIRAMSKEDVPCLYWTASALGKWAKLTGFTTLLKHKDTVKAYITKVDELDHSYNFAAPDRYWGAYYAIAPSFAGGDLNKSKIHFDKSIEAAPEYLATRVLYAQYFATKQQDKALFDRLLNEVLAADASVVTELAPENRAEQVKAKNLLDTKSDYFAN